MGLAVLGLQQSSVWGWTGPATIACIAVGVLLLLVLVRVELRTASPLIDVNIFRDRGFAAANGVLLVLSMAFIPVLFFTSMYAQISVGDDASSAGLFLLVFFAGCGLILGPASTDALNRVSAARYGEATGITQTMRNFGASVGLAVLGTVLIMRTESNVEGSLGALGVPADRAQGIAEAITGSGGGRPSGGFGERAGPVAQRAFEAVRGDFADATATVFYVMAGIMAALYVIARIWLPEGRVVQEQPEEREATG